MAAALATNPILLGYPDELIGPESAQHLDFTTSKIGGKPNWPPNASTQLDLKCHCCGHTTVLVTQIYAPLDGSVFHRTLYMFACLSPGCWNRSESWKCIRLQMVDPSYNVTKAEVLPPVKNTQSSLFSECDDWDDDIEEENGNVLPPKAKFLEQFDSLTLSDDSHHRSHSSPSSSDDTSEIGPEPVDPNANANACIQGAAAMTPVDDAKIGSMGSAEIEADQDGTDMIAIDTPELGDVNIPRLFQTATTNDNMRQRNANTEFIPYYLAVEEEAPGQGLDSPTLTEHERQLLLEYKAKEAASGLKEVSQRTRSTGNGDRDGYEKVLPRHGDAYFHKFISVIQQCPGQILRYSRDPKTEPLLLREHPRPLGLLKCSHCGDRMICEVQILPTLLPVLHLRSSVAVYEPDATTTISSASSEALEFGTVLIYTCRASCWETSDDKSYRLEHVIVQEEVI
ncbi:hypothetical protein TCAL_10545 [Tigriopus californicus]|uniref:Programmed cell death protein 2 C-terminal domain-containing protein n=1 Tax=Tigriopus californicus TaxID=6832 RepID=A0A553P442_TIGCA|nr:programmed cell death protein 2-like [Tigriopus californicus]TRY72459.1 hypothetical protein TCAL_10545 [Tigriopus californicus]|eukprot:TCALIF_10545-PA protein Name:"Similar to Pdcd2l Programmed cell death protein 2-like (Mus musculus)" AED:0.30 eAED:0.30 QI:277/1/1/1/1/1/4/500/453